MLHHYLEYFSLGETTLRLHADNCSGQNKNRYMLEYLAWRVLAGLHEEIELSFMVVGHTKFAPDWCFGLLKRTLRRTKIGCLDDIVMACEKSAKVNFSQLVGTQEGEVIVPTYDWQSFLGCYFRRDPFSGLKKLHHLRFHSEHPGKCFVRASTDEPEKEIEILQDTGWQPSPSNLPNIIMPVGLSRERQWYLYKKIREFCPAHCRDLVCPMPTGENPASPAPSPDDSSAHSIPGPPPTKKRRGRPKKIN